MEECGTITQGECVMEARMPCLHGLHLRSSANLVRLAQRFASEISIQRGRCQGDAKSVLNVLALGVCFKARVRIRARGDDAEQAANAIASYLNERANCFD